MPITQLKAIHVAHIKVEVTEGTDVVPAAGDSLQLAEPGILTYGAEIMNERPDLLNQLLDEAKNLAPGGVYAEYSGKIHCRGFGSAYSSGNKPEVSAVLQAIGMSETGTFTGGTENYVYDTASVNMKTVTVYAYHGLETNVWVRHIILAGRVSKLEIECRAGEPCVISFTIRGIYIEPTDTSPVAPTYQTATPPIFGGASAFVLGSYAAPVCRSAKVTFDNTVVPRLNANVAGHLAGYLQTRRRVTFEARFEATRISDYNAINRWTGALTDTWALKFPGGAGGGTQYNRMQLDGTTATILAPPAYEDERGIWVRNISGLLSPEGANRAKITFN